jgi:hypothetical protein
VFRTHQLALYSLCERIFQKISYKKQEEDPSEQLFSWMRMRFALQPDAIRNLRRVRFRALEVVRKGLIFVFGRMGDPEADTCECCGEKRE